MSMRKVTNYNLSFELLVEAIKEYESFVTGGKLNNSLFSYGLGNTTFGILSSKTTSANQQERFILKDFALRVLDRTTGGYFLRDIMKGAIIPKYSLPEYSANYIEIFREPQDGIISKVTYQRDVFNRGTGLYKDIPEGGPVSIKKTITHIDIGSENLKKKGNPKPAANASGTEDPAKQKTPDNKYAYQFDGSRSPTYDTLSVVNKEPSKEPHRILSPSLGAMVMKHAKLNLSGRRADHLSVFFNAITPIEMSRCAPYLSITIMNESAANDTGAKGLNPTAWMKFIKKNSDDEMILDDGIGLGIASPVETGTTNDLFQLPSEFLKRNYTYMDAFNAPQTLSNANINNTAAYVDALDIFGMGSIHNKTTVLEPISPMLTLTSFDASITGNGFGLMASKVASLTLILHDRSRLKDIQSLLAIDKFAANKLRIEFGWSHPEGGPQSNNTIGKYLDALKDSSLYSIRSVDYSFGSGNTVNINIKLIAAGFTEGKSASAAAGAKVPLSLFKDYINRSLEAYIRKRNGTKNKPIPQLHSTLNISQSTANSPLSLIHWSSLQEWFSAIKSGNTQLVKEKVAEMLQLKETGQPITDTQLQKNIQNNFITAQAVSSGKFLSAKIESCQPGLSPDPFALSFITECADTPTILSGDISSIERKNIFTYQTHDPIELNAHYVTMGKLVMSFIGHSLAACGLYDEVQVFFYPINHLAAGARKHTTASFPIKFDIIREEISKFLEKSSRMTVSAFFTLLERVASDRNNYVYGIAGVHNDIDEYKSKKTTEERVNLAKAYFESNNQPLPVDPNETDQTKINNKILNAYKDVIRAKKKSSLGEKLKYIYNNDGCQPRNPKVFVSPNFSIFYETIPVINSQSLEWSDLNPFKSIMDLSSAETNSQGFKLDRTILRVHVYDEEAVSSPAMLNLNNIMIRGSKLVGGDYSESHATSLDVLIKESAKGASDKSEKTIEYAKGMSYNDLKMFIKREYPSITFGAGSGVVTNINVNANASGELANVLLTEAYGNKLKAATAQNKGTPDFDDIQMFPGTLSVEMLGNPCISRGENIFIDFSTDTSFDNIYTVKSVRHSVKSGRFSTTLEMVVANQGAVRSFRSNLLTKLDELLPIKT